MATQTRLRLTKVTPDFDDFKSSLVNNPVGSTLDYMNVKDYSNAHFYLTIPPGSAIVTLKGSFDEVNFVPITSYDETGTEYATLNSNGSYWANVAGFKVVRWETTTGGSSAGSLVGRMSRVGQGWSSGNPVTTVESCGGGGGVTGTVDSNNSTTSPVLAGITFTGLATEVKDYSTIVINIKADQNGTLFVEHSSDSTNWDISDSYVYVAGDEYSLRTPVLARYYRLRFTNGVTNQTTFRMQALLGSQAVDPPAATIDTTGLAVSGIILTGNSSSANLGAGATFTGSPTEVTPYSIIVTSVMCNEDTTLYIDFSSDGINWDITTTHHIDQNIGESINANVQAKFVRVRLLNEGASTTTSLRLQTIASVGNTKDGIVSGLNSTDTPLGAGVTFTGGWDQVSEYSTITIYGRTDQNATLYAEYSHDSSGVLSSIQLNSGNNTSLGPHSLLVLTKFFRIRIVCGATPMGLLELETLYFKGAKMSVPTSRINSEITEYSDVINTRAMPFGQKPDGTYQMAKADGFAFTTTSNLSGTTLNGAITDSDTTVTVVDTTGFPSPAGTITIESEEITYTGTTATTFTGCTRGTGGTTAIAHNDGTAVGELYTSGILNSDGFSQVQTSINASHTGRLYVLWYSDSGGTNTIRTVNIEYENPGNYELYSAPIFAKYIEYRFYNYGGTDQTDMYYSTQFLTKSINPQILGAGSFIAPAMVATLNRSIITGQRANGEYKNVALDTENYLEVAIRGPTLPFGSIWTESMTPIFRYDGVYTLNNLNFVDSSNAAGLGGTASVVDSAITCNTTASIFGNATVQTRKRLRYKAGQGSIMRFTSKYTSGGAVNTYQVVGIGHPEDGYYIGYKDTTFGILYVQRNLREIAKLTVTAGATSAGNVTITLGGTAYVVALSANPSGSIPRTAYEIATYNYDGWKAHVEGNDVWFLAGSSGVKTNTYTFNAGTTGATVTSFARERAGDKTTYPETFIPQSAWNGDVLDGSSSSSNPSGVLLDPSKYNIWEIQMQYLGAGPVTFRTMIPPNGKNPTWVSVHTILNPNSLVRTHIGNPSLPFTMSAYKFNSATNLTISCGSVLGAIEGRSFFHGPRFSYRNGTSGSTASTTLQTLFMVQNSYIYQGIPNQCVIFIRSLTAAARGSNNVLTTIYLIRNPTIAGAPVWNRFDNAHSCGLFSTTIGLTVTVPENNHYIYSTTIGETGQVVETFSDNSEEFEIQPGEVVAVCTQTTQGTSYVTASLNTREDQ